MVEYRCYQTDIILEVITYCSLKKFRLVLPVFGNKEVSYEQPAVGNLLDLVHIILT